MLPSERSPLRVESLRLTDFKGLRDLTLDFRADGAAHDQILLLGANATGKTTVLEALALLLGYGKADYASTDAQDSLVRFGANDFRIQAGVSATHTDGRRYGFPIGLTRERLVEWVSSPTLPPSQGNSTQGPHATDIQTLSPEVHWFKARTEDEGQSLSTLNGQLVNAAYHRITSHRQPDAAQDDPLARIQRAWQRFESFESSLEVLPESNNPASAPRVLIRPGRPVPLDVTSLAMARSLAPHRSDVPSLVPFSQISAGQRVLLSYLGPLVFRDRPPDVVLIDEAERHLHPEWAMRLIPALREVAPEAQFIVVSHSTYLARQFRPEEIFVLAKAEDGQVQAARLQDHTDYERLKGVLDPGEFWSSVGEDWVLAKTADNG